MATSTFGTTIAPHVTDAPEPGALASVLLDQRPITVAEAAAWENAAQAVVVAPLRAAS